MKHKKITAFLLSIAMIAGMVPAVAFADSEEQVDETAVEQEEIEEKEEEQEEPLNEDTQESEIALNDDEGDPESESATEADLQNEPDEVISGPAGESATWTLDSSGTLVISGTGDIDEQILHGDPAWTNDVQYSIRSIRIEEGITGVGDYSFQYTWNLESVSIPGTVTCIGDNAFYYCSVLTQVNISENSSLTTIEYRAFGNCSSLRSFFIPSSVTYIGELAFSGCEKLKTVSFAENSKLKTIDNSAFENCISLTSITIPDSITRIEDYAFYECDNLLLVYCNQDPDNIEYWGIGSFKKDCETFGIVPQEYCVKYTERFPEANLIFVAEEDIGKCGDDARWLFNDDTHILYVFGTGDMYDFENEERSWYEVVNKIQKVIIGADITSIGNYAFSFHDNLEEVEFANDSKLTKIGNNAFISCYSIKKLTIPCGVTTIDDKAFLGCGSLTSVSIPESVTFIGENAFIGCVEISDVYLYADPDKLTWNEFNCNDFKYNRATICHVNKEYYDKFLSKFGSTVNVTFDGNLVDVGSAVVHRGYSLTLTGEIGINFYLELKGEPDLRNDASILFTLPNGEEENIYFGDPEKVVEDTSTIPGKTLYVIQRKVAAKDVGSEIKAKVFKSDEPCGEEYTFSVKDYIDYLIDNSNLYDETTVDLAEALLNYCEFAQDYFGIEAQPDVSKIADVVIDDEYKYDGNANLPNGVTFEGASLSLKSETTLSLYFKNTSGNDLDLGCDEYEVEKVCTDTYEIARIRGIKAQDLGNKIKLKINGDYYIEYCPLSYCYRVINGGSDNVKLQNVCKALYKYYEAARAYADAHKDDR